MPRAGHSGDPRRGAAFGDRGGGPRGRALQVLEEARSEQKLLTGLLYVAPEQTPFEEDLKPVETPLAALPLEKVRPPQSVLDEIMSQYMTGKGLTAPAGGG